MANYEVAVILPVIFVIGYYGYLINIIKQEMFEAHGFLKSIFLIVNFWLLLFPISLAIDINANNSGTDIIKNTLANMYKGMIYLNLFFTFYFVTFIMVSMIRRIMEKNATK